jgi:hypothetical protein
VQYSFLTTNNGRTAPLRCVDTQHSAFIAFVHFGLFVCVDGAGGLGNHRALMMSETKGSACVTVRQACAHGEKDNYMKFESASSGLEE